MQWILWLFLLFSGFYLLVVALVIFALNRLKKRPLNSDLPFISVVIAAKNEQGRLNPLLTSLAALEYPKEKYEIILVDDSSKDDTAKILKAEANSFTLSEPNKSPICCPDIALFVPSPNHEPTMSDKPEDPCIFETKPPKSKEDPEPVELVPAKSRDNVPIASVISTCPSLLLSANCFIN